MSTLSLLSKLIPQPSMGRPLLIALVAVGVCSPAFAATSKNSAENAPRLKVEKVLTSTQADRERPEVVDPYAQLTVHAVSTYDYTRFVFPEAVHRLFIANEGALQEPPEYIAGNTAVLLLFAKTEAKRPLQVVVSFQSGETTTLYVKPGDVPGSVVNVGGGKAAKAAASAPVPVGAKHASDVRLLQQFVQGAIPSGFSPLPIPAPTRFDRFTVTPELAVSDGNRNVYVFQLTAAGKQVSVISPSQFYRNGVTAVLVDGDRLDPSTPRRVFLVEAANE